MDALLHFAGNFWWLIFPLGGVIGGAAKGVAAANERRAQRRLERYRIKQETRVALASDDAATPQERRNAYGRAQKELDGLIVLPAATRAAIQSKVIGEIEA